MKNQNGSANILALSLLVLITGIMTIWALKRSNTFLKHQYLQRQQVCFKNFLIESRSLITKIESVNDVIINIKTISIISSFLGIPGKIIQKIGSKGVLKILYLMQETQKNNFLFKLRRIKRQKCHFSLSTYKTPYQLRGIKLKRNFKGQAILRRRYRGYFSKKNFFLTYKLRPNKKDYFDVKFISI
jgi:hypothetical protein